MPSHEAQAASPEFASVRPLFNRFLRRIGFAKLTRIGLEERKPLVWYALIVIGVELVILQGYNLVIGRPVGFAENPIRFIELTLVLGTAVAVGALHQRYDRAVKRSHLVERTNDPSQFEYLTPDWLSLILILSGIIYTLLNAFIGLSIGHLYEIGGPARVIRFVFVIPFGYVPILATGIAAYLSAEVLVPRRIKQSDIGLDYLDPEQLGGLRPIGELVKFAYYLVMLALIAYAIATYGPHILGGIFEYEAINPPGRLTNITFTTVWAAAVGAMVYGIYVLHRFMAEEKWGKLQLLHRRAYKQLPQPWKIEEFDAANPPEEYERFRGQVDLIASTREYPAKFTMWTQLLIGVLLPKAVQLTLSAI
jgi:hypothetical protein